MTTGAHFVRSTTNRWYVYAWRGGPRIATVDGGAKPRLSRELQQKAKDARDEALRSPETILGLVRDWRRSPEWRRLADNTRATWTPALNRIEAKWGDTPLELWNDPRMVRKVIAWRDEQQDRPRAADIAVTVLSRLLEWGRLRARVQVNVAAGVPGLYEGADRAEIVWTEEDDDRFCRSALMLDAPLLIDALDLSGLTGFRLADLAAVTIDEVGEHAIVRTALKRSRGRRRRAVVPVLPELRLLVADLMTRPREHGVRTLLVNSFGRPWKADALGKRFGQVRDHAGIVHRAEGEPDRPKHLHDRRGTFVTRLCRAGLTDDQIADTVAWSAQSVGRIRKTYVDDAAVVVAIGRRISQQL